MKKIILVMVFAVNILYSEPQRVMTCNEILNEIDALRKFKKSEESGNYEYAERILLGAMGKFYLADRRADGRNININPVS